MKLKREIKENENNNNNNSNNRQTALGEEIVHASWSPDNWRLQVHHQTQSSAFLRFLKCAIQSLLASRTHLHSKENSKEDYNTR